MKRGILYFFGVIGAAMFAIIVHAVMPSPGASLDVTSFDSALVKQFGFPVVASVYFIILYLHILCVVHCLGLKSMLCRKEVGLRFGLAFALIYMIGMQEVVVSASPFDTYGMDFIFYQLFMGLGDAIPAIVFCVLIGRFASKTVKMEKQVSTITCKDKVIIISVIGTMVFLERVIGYAVGYIDSDIQVYPGPVLIWTMVFGIAFGCAYLLVRPIYQSSSVKRAVIRSVIFSLGINWIWFNCFMGLILEGMMFKMFLRSGVDVIVIFIAIWFLEHKWLMQRERVNVLYKHN